MILNPRQILYEDNHLLILNKLSGQLSDEDESGDETLADKVKAYIKEKYAKPGDVFLGTPHRLDRPTSGAIIYTRTSKALERMNLMIRDRQLKKTYWALVIKRPPTEEGTLKNYLLRVNDKNLTKVYAKPVTDAKEAILHYKLRMTKGIYHLLEIDLETGRHHQIRAQLANIGCPIVGDLKYGYKEPNQDKSICLHARKLEFEHPVKKERMTIIAPVPGSGIWQGFDRFDGR